MSGDSPYLAAVRMVDGLPGKPKPREEPARIRRQRAPNAFDAAGLQRSLANARHTSAELHYQAARVSKYKHDVSGLGGTADAHYAQGLDYWRLREYVREFDRNDPILGQLVERGLDNILGSGLTIDPDSGDAEVNARARSLWESWASSPNACDFSGRYTFDELERLALRHAWVDGDCFLIQDDRTGALRFEEGDRVTSRDDFSGDTIHGVVLDRVGRPVAYQFDVLRPGQRKWNRLSTTTTGDQVTIPSEYVIHVYFPKRATQTRGVSAFAPVVEQISLVQDIEFARLVKLQVSSCIAGFVYSDHPGSFNFGGATTETSDYDDSTDLDFAEFTPAMFGKLRAGEKFQGYTPQVSSSGESEFVEAVIRRIGLSIGLPIEISLLTTKDTSFSGFRGVVEQYKITARVIQQRFKRLLRSRVYRWKVQQWVEEGLLPDLPTVAKHTVLVPTWPYIDPEKDAKADALRIEKGLASPRQVWAERGRDYDQGVREMATDASARVRELARAAKELRDDPEAGAEDVTWRDLVLVAGSDVGASPAPLAVAAIPEEAA